MLWCLCLFKFYLNNTTNQNKTKEQQIKKKKNARLLFKSENVRVSFCLKECGSNLFMMLFLVTALVQVMTFKLQKYSKMFALDSADINSLM